nr:hypothetical protein [Streptomyces paludis]
MGNTPRGTVHGFEIAVQIIEREQLNGHALSGTRGGGCCLKTEQRGGDGKRTNGHGTARTKSR